VQIRKVSWVKAITIFVESLWLAGSGDPAFNGVGPVFRDSRRGCASDTLANRPGTAFDQDHVCPGCAMPHLARFAVLFAVEPFPGAVG
jgi:hypothetical protein